MTERAPPSQGARFRVNPRRRMTLAALVALMIVAGVGLSSAPASAQDKKPNIRLHPCRQHRLRRHRRLRRRRAAWGTDAAHRSTGIRRTPADSVPRRARMHAVPGGIDDGHYSIRSGLSLVADVFPGSTGADLPGGLRKAGVIHTMRRLIKETRRMKLPVRFACRPGRSRAVA